MNKEELVDVTGAEVTSHVTKPPKNHTERTLLRVMETCGKSYKEDESEELLGSILTGFSIGTAATRAETIKKLKDVGYITTESKHLLCTELGNRLVEIFPVKNLFDLEFTGRLEKGLSDIQKGKASKQEFLRLVFDFTTESVETIKDGEDIIINKVASTRATNEVLGTCPECGGKVIDGYKAFNCSNWKKGCSFAIWKNDKYLASMRKNRPKQW